MEDMNEGNEELKKIMFVFKKSPHGTIFPYEGLEVILLMAAYEQDLSVVFIEDGVFVIKKGQDTSKIGIKEFSKTFTVLPEYDVEKIYVERESLETRGLTADDMIIDVEVLGKEEILKLMQESDVLLPF